MLPLTEWRFHLLDPSKNMNVMPGIDDDAGKCVVLTEDTPDSPTVYTNATGTTLTETGGVAVLTFTNGEIRFWTQSTVTALDIAGITVLGRTFALNSVTPSQQMIPINPLNAYQLLVVPFGASDNAETDTGFDLPANCLIHPLDVKLRVTTVDATETIDFGILSSEANGDANGFITAASVATPGFVELLPQITGGTNIDYVGANYVGALLSTSIAGADAVATVGGFTYEVYRTDGTAKSITYTGSAGSDTAAGYMYLSFRLLPF
jgi:hypothetical protein